MTVQLKEQPEQGTMKVIEEKFETGFVRVFKILHLPLFLGLVPLMGLVVWQFGLELIHLFSRLTSGAAHGEDALIMGVLGLLDLVMIGNLIMFMAISGYENHVSKIEPAGEGSEAYKGLGFGTLKVKLVASIVGISTVKLLYMFLDPGQVDEAKLKWMTILHVVFILTVVFLGLVDRYLVAHEPGDRH